MAATKESFRAAVESLIRKFDADKETYRSPGYNESNTRLQFINPLFRALGWDVNNEQGVPYHLCEVWVEAGETVGRPDYTFRLNGQTKFFIEAKAPSAQLTNKEHVLQAKSYAWSSRDVLFAGLTDFEEFRFFDATLKPDERHPFVGEAFHLQYTEYLEQLDKLWELSRDRVADGSLDQFLKRDRKSISYRKPVDEDFLEELTAWRRDLARTIHSHNPGLDARALNEIVQRLLDRIVFLRIAEDRRVIEPRQLYDIAGLWEQRGGKRPIMEDLVALFQRINQDFNGEIFKAHACEQVKLESHVVAKIIRALYPPKSPYRFDAIEVQLLGSIYERYLGNTLHVTPKQVRIEQKPEVRKAGGVYYTPKFIVEYIVKNTVGKLVEGRTPKEVKDLRILHPACGSGSFLLGAYQFLLDWHLDYYREHPQEARVHPMLPEVEKDLSGKLKLTLRAKTQILSHNLYGVDIDPQAVEITMMSLYLKALEGEFMLVGPKQARLPELKYNIRCGNSLIGPDIEKDAPLSPEERQRIRPFDWHSREDGFGDILSIGGFDAVIGNPPYVRPHKLPLQVKQYFWQMYPTFVKKSDLYNCFIERGLSLCRNGGRMAFIVSDGWLRLDSFDRLRIHILENAIIHELVDLPVGVFAEAQVKTCIFVLEKSSLRSKSSQHAVLVRHVRTLDTSLELARSSSIPQNHFGNTFKSVFDLSYTPEIEALRKKVASCAAPLGTALAVQFGLKTGDDTKFVLKQKRHKEDKKLLRGENVFRYSYRWAGDWVWYVPARMRAHRATSRPGEPARFEQPKIMVKDTTRDFGAAFEPGVHYAKDVLIVTHPKKDEKILKLVLGILNSKLMRFYYRLVFATLHVQNEELQQLPVIPEGRSSLTANRIIEKVDEMIQQCAKLHNAPPATQKQSLKVVTKLDAEIDDLVYDLYGLTAEERKLVEESLAEAK
jgi:type I restriction-modification system DNA methylase subunit